MRDSATPLAGLKVFLVDDHPLVRDHLRILMHQAGFTPCGQADNASDALTMIESSSPDVVIADIALGCGRNGLELLKDIKARHPGLPVLVLSMHDEALFAERVMRAGASGYVSKQEPPANIIAAIQQVMKGETYMNEKTAAIFAKRFIQGKTRKRGSLVHSLTDRELEVFQLIGQGQNSRAIAEALRLDYKTVETYRGRIKAKLQLGNSTELHQFAYQWWREGGGREN
jgi:DNA-binding NarL/FixJ family response regulator